MNLLVFFFLKPPKKVLYYFLRGCNISPLAHLRYLQILRCLQAKPGLRLNGRVGHLYTRKHGEKINLTV